MPRVEVDNAGILSIKPGTLDNAQGLRPVGHIWVGSKPPWVALDEGCLQYPGNPDSYEALMGRWEARGAGG